jgi:apolipoprotein N-acyltransferase
VFALVPALPVFRLHQWIAYGGTFGEYYAYGLRPYAIAFAIYWGTAVIYLVLWAALLRVLLEPLVVAAAWLAPARALGVRRAVETVDRVLYYGGVPLFLGRLFLRS